MSNESDVVKKAAEKISNEANLQILSHSVMALKQRIEDRLKRAGDVYSIFEGRVKSLYGENAIRSGNPSYKAYVYLECTQGKEEDNFKNFARIYSKIDKVTSIEDGSISYALHLRITSHGNVMSSYEEGFISKDCGRFAVGHDIGHAVLNLGDLIRNATTNDNQSTIKDKEDDNTAKHYEADFFSYILSDLRDFYLLELKGKFELNKALESYKDKAISKFSESILKEIKAEITQDTLIDTKQFINKIINKIKKRLDEIKEVFIKSKELYDESSLKYTMSHPIIALNRIINFEFQLKVNKTLKELRDKLSELELKKEYMMILEEGIYEIKIEDITTEDISKIEKIISRNKSYREMKDLNKEIEDLNKEIEDLTNKKPVISIHLISKEEYDEKLTIDCYKRKDENTKKVLYCFEIVINKFFQENKSNICKKICKAIGFIYFGYEFLIDIVDRDNRFGGTIFDMLQRINDSNLSEEKINDFAEELFNLRDDNFKNIRDKKKNEMKLKNRLIGYVV